MALIWKKASNGEIPNGAVICGNDVYGTPLYLCRAKYEGGIHPGKVRPAFGAANIPYGDGEVKVNSYEVYCGGGKWVRSSDGEIPSGTVICGQEADGTPLYATRKNYAGGVYPGKAHPAFLEANTRYNPRKLSVPTYEVLVED